MEGGRCSGSRERHAGVSTREAACSTPSGCPRSAAASVEPPDAGRVSQDTRRRACARPCALGAHAMAAAATAAQGGRASSYWLSKPVIASGSVAQACAGRFRNAHTTDVVLDRGSELQLLAVAASHQRGAPRLLPVAQQPLFCAINAMAALPFSQMAARCDGEHPHHHAMQQQVRACQRSRMYACMHACMRRAFKCQLVACVCACALHLHEVHASVSCTPACLRPRMRKLPSCPCRLLRSTRLLPHHSSSRKMTWCCCWRQAACWCCATAPSCNAFTPCTSDSWRQVRCAGVLTHLQCWHSV